MVVGRYVQVVGYIQQRVCSAQNGHTVALYGYIAINYTPTLLRHAAEEERIWYENSPLYRVGRSRGRWERVCQYHLGYVRTYARAFV